MSDLAPVDPVALRYLLAPYGLEVSVVPDDAPIPGSYWGDP